MKLTKRKGFNFFRSYFDVYNELPDKDKVKFIDALLDRQFLNEKPTTLDGMAKFAYISQTNSIDSQVKGFIDKMNKLEPGVNPFFSTPTIGATVGSKNSELTPTLQVEEKGKEEVQEEVQEEEEEQPKIFSSEVMDCYFECLECFPISLCPSEKQTESWIETVEKLNRIEKIPFDQILKIVKWTRADSFWCKNFLSLTKLRKKNKEGIMNITVYYENLKSTKNNGQGQSRLSEEAQWALVDRAKGNQ